MLQARIIDTCIGAGIALIVACFFFSNRTNVACLLGGYLQKMKASIANVFLTRDQACTLVSGKSLVDEFQHIKKDAFAIRYELLFHRLNPRHFYTLLSQFEYCTQTILNLTESYEWFMAYLEADERERVLQAAKTSINNIEAVMSGLSQNIQLPFVPAADVFGDLKQVIISHPERFATLESNAFGFFSLMYLLTRLNEVLHEAYVLINTAYETQKISV
mgnify:CR=1 FL=1